MSPLSSSFEMAFRFVIGEEGVFSLSRFDAGNWTGGTTGVGLLRGTRYGISAAAFPCLDIRRLTLPQALAIYRVHYWNPIGGDELPAPLALLVFDMAVNQGVRTAALALQAAVHVATDGVIGPVTLAAARAAPLAQVLRKISVARILDYASDASWASFGEGWSKRLLTIFLRASQEALGGGS